MVFTLVVSLRLHIQIIGGIIGTMSVAVWGVGMFEGDVRRLRISIALTALLFTISLLDQIWTRVRSLIVAQSCKSFKYQAA